MRFSRQFPRMAALAARGRSAAMNCHAVLSSLTVALALAAGGLTGFAQAPADALEAILAAHGADLGPPPVSVVMTGVSERGGQIAPFRLLATRDEELRIEYGASGTDTVVRTPKLSFRDDGQKVATRQAGSGFTQLDVTGLFLVQQFRNRAVSVDRTEDWAMVGGARSRRVRVSSGRSHQLPGRIRVDDRADLYVTEAGLLSAVTRTFYEGRPERYVLTFLFSDYRETPDKMLLPRRIEVYVNNKKRETYTVETYAFGVPAGRALFEPRRAR